MVWSPYYPNMMFNTTANLEEMTMYGNISKMGEKKYFKPINTELMLVITRKVNSDLKEL